MGEVDGAAFQEWREEEGVEGDDDGDDLDDGEGYCMEGVREVNGYREGQAFRLQGYQKGVVPKWRVLWVLER